MRHVLISKKWDNPLITCEVTSEQLNISMTLEDFAQCLITELGPVATRISTKTFSADVKSAMNKIITDMKDQTAKVI